MPCADCGKSTVDTIKIFLTRVCNFRCEYCYIHLDKEVMAPAILDKVLLWGIENSVQTISLFGGEPTSSFDLIVRAAKFMKKNYPNPDFQFAPINTNGTQLNRARIQMAKALGLKFVFSLDGYDYESNIYRHRNRKEYERIIENMQIYTQLYGAPPKISMTVSPKSAHLLYENTLSFIKRGYTKVQVRPVYGQPWTDEGTEAFLESFEKLLLAHKRLTDRSKALDVYPIDFYRRQIKSRDYEGITQSHCDMGSKVAFSINGEAHACMSTLQLKDHDPLRKEYYLGDVHSYIDLEKMRKFKDYRICSEFPVTRKYDFPNISCRKVCATIDFATGERIEAKYIENLMKIEYTMFQRTYETYLKKDSFDASPLSLDHKEIGLPG